jgi:hypothetical protein
MVKLKFILRRSFSWAAVLSVWLAFGRLSLILLLFLALLITAEVRATRRGGGFVKASTKHSKPDRFILPAFFLVVVISWIALEHNKSDTWPWLVLGVVFTLTELILSYKDPLQWRTATAKPVK